MTCRQLVELVTDYLEGGLPESERERFDAHLATCPGCVTYLEQMRATVRLAHETKALERRPEVIALLRAFRDWQASSTG